MKYGFRERWECSDEQGNGLLLKDGVVRRVLKISTASFFLCICPLQVRSIVVYCEFYSRIRPTKFPVPGAGNVSARSRVCIDQCVSVVRGVEMSVFVCLHSSCNHATEVGEP